MVEKFQFHDGVIVAIGLFEVFLGRRPEANVFEGRAKHGFVVGFSTEVLAADNLHDLLKKGYFGHGGHDHNGFLGIAPGI